MADTAAHGFVNLFHYFGATSEKYHMTSYPSDVLLLKADTVLADPGVGLRVGRARRRATRHPRRARRPQLDVLSRERTGPRPGAVGRARQARLSAPAAAPAAR